MQSKIIGILILLALVVTAGWLLVFSGDIEKEQTASFLTAEESSGVVSEESVISQTAPSVNSGQAILVVDFGQDKKETFELPIIEQAFVFDLLQGSGLELEFKEYDVGVFIEAIEGVENGTGNKYWLYYVNEEMPMVSADKQPVKPGDKVEFRFEESTF